MRSVVPEAVQRAVGCRLPLEPRRQSSQHGTADARSSVDAGRLTSVDVRVCTSRWTQFVAFSAGTRSGLGCSEVFRAAEPGSVSWVGTGPPSLD